MLPNLLCLPSTEVLTCGSRTSACTWETSANSGLRSWTSCGTSSGEESILYTCEEGSVLSGSSSAGTLIGQFEVLRLSLLSSVLTFWGE